MLNRKGSAESWGGGGVSTLMFVRVTGTRANLTEQLLASDETRAPYRRSTSSVNLQLSCNILHNVTSVFGTTNSTSLCTLCPNDVSSTSVSLVTAIKTKSAILVFRCGVRSLVTPWPLKTGPTACPETSLTTNLRYITSQKSEDLQPKRPSAQHRAVPTLFPNTAHYFYFTRRGTSVGLPPYLISWHWVEQRLFYSHVRSSHVRHVAYNRKWKITTLGTMR
jgi:hypothetical protein